MKLFIVPKMNLIRVSFIFAIILLAFSCSKKSGQPLDLGPVTLQAPEEWASTPPTSMMRKAQFTLPRAEGDAEDGELVVFYFRGEGGAVDANFRRWADQFAQTDSTPSFDKAKTSKATVDDLPLATMDLSGTYIAPITPMDPTNRYNKPDFRMLAAVLETSEGPYYFKLVGPEKTIEKWAGAYWDFVKSAKKK
jgi:hypothetical protein